MKRESKAVQVYRHPVVTIVNNHPTTTSLAVAKFFGKNHKDVIRAIANLHISEEFTERNFAPSEYVDSTGRKLPMYEMTKSGFAFVGMGFTGPQATQFKEAYIERFDYMEEQLRNLSDKRYIGLLEEYRAVSEKNRELYEDNRALHVTLMDHLERKPMKPVSRREHEIICQLKREGKTTAQIKEKTGWSKSTITTHVRMGRERGEVPPMSMNEKLKLIHLQPQLFPEVR